MGGTCNPDGRSKKYIQNFSRKAWKRDCVHSWIILKFILKKKVRLCIRFIWLTIGSSGGVSWIQKLTFGFQKGQKLSWLAEQLSASEEGLCSMQLVLYKVILKFPNWPPGARTANGTALCHYMLLYRYSASQSSEFCRHNPLRCFSTSVYCCCLLRYPLSPETFGYSLVVGRLWGLTMTERARHVTLCGHYFLLKNFRLQMTSGWEFQ